MRAPGTTFSRIEILLAVVVGVSYVGIGFVLGRYYYGQHLASEQRPTGTLTKEDFPNGRIPNLNVTIFVVGDACPQKDAQGNMSWRVPEAGTSGPAADFPVLGMNLSFQRIYHNDEEKSCISMASATLPFSFQVTTSPTSRHKQVLGLMDDIVFDEYYCQSLFAPVWSPCSRDCRSFHVGKMDLMTGYEDSETYEDKVFMLPYALSTSDVQKFVDSWPSSVQIGASYDGGVDVASVLAPSFPEGVFFTGGQGSIGTVLKFSQKRTTTIRAGRLYGLFGEVREDVITTSVSAMPSVKGAGIILIVEPELSQETFAVQITLQNALTSWFTMLHTILAICLALFPTAPTVPRYFTFGSWTGRYKTKLHAMAAGFTRDGESLQPM